MFISLFIVQMLIKYLYGASTVLGSAWKKKKQRKIAGLMEFTFWYLAITKTVQKYTV